MRPAHSLAAYGVLAVAVALYALAAIGYLLVPGYLLSGEAGAALLALRSLDGLPVYHTPASAEVYSYPYGPATFLLQGWWLALFSDAVLGSKVYGVLWAAAGLVFLYHTLRLWLSAPQAAFLLSWHILILLRFYQTSFWDRGDTLMVAGLSMAAWAWLGAAGRCVALRRRLGVLVGGVALALAIGSKLTAAVYFAPLALVAWRMERAADTEAAGAMRSVGSMGSMGSMGFMGFMGFMRFKTRLPAASVLIAVPLLILPFLHPSFDLEGYAHVLAYTARHGLYVEKGLGVLTEAFVVTLPFWLAMACLLLSPAASFAACRLGRGVSLDAFLMFALVALAAVFGAKGGAGSRHAMPLAPVAMALAARLLPYIDFSALWRRLTSLRSLYLWPAVMTAFLVVVSVVATSALRAFLTGHAYTPHRLMKLEESAAVLTTLAQEGFYGLSYAFGWSDKESFFLTRSRPYGYGDGYRPFLHPVALMDSAFGGVPLPDKALSAVRGEEIDVWLVPRPLSADDMQAEKDAVFTFVSYYRQWHGAAPMFPDDSFRLSFLEHYVPATALGPWRVWCARRLVGRVPPCVL